EAVTSARPRPHPREDPGRLARPVNQFPGYRWAAASRRTPSPAGQAGRGRQERREIAYHRLATELLHRPGKPAGVLTREAPRPNDDDGRGGAKLGARGWTGAPLAVSLG